MNILAWLLLMPLTFIAALHLYWAFGGRWPARSEADLVRTVVGAQNATKMPGKGLTLLVALLIFSAAVWPVAYLAGALPYALGQIGIWVITLIFIGRGAVTYLLPAIARKSSEPFGRLNARYYSPLCLALGVGFLTIALSS